METKKLTCIECPIGCEITVETDGEKIYALTGNTCPRGKLYAENEIVCPKRVITSTIKAKNGKMVPVKTDKPVTKSKIFAIMDTINKITVQTPVKIGDVVYENISDGANLIVTGNIK